MVKTGKPTEKWVAVALALAVLCLGLVISYSVYHSSAARHQQKLAEQFEDITRQYTFLAQRQLDVYAAANQSLAGFMSASDDVSNEEFETYIKESHYFERLKSLSSVGYLPRVSAQAVLSFERKASKQFPGYRIKDTARGADHYPLFYGVYAAGKARMEAMRGVDLASSPERLAAIRAAESGSTLAATPVLAALRDPDRKPVLLTFAPARTRHHGPALQSPEGVVFTTISVQSFFEGIDDGRVAGLFDLEVFAGGPGQKNLLYDADGVAQAGTKAAASLPVYPRTMYLADQTWTAYFFAKPAYLAANADHDSTTLLIIGLLLSSIAAYITFRIAGHYVGRQKSAALAERFEAIFEAHPFAAYALDQEGRLVSVNQKMVRELGIPKDALIGKSANQFVVEENRKMAAAHFIEVLAGQAVAYNNTVVRKDGTRSDVAVVLIPILNGGEVIRVLGFAENITERKQMEAELLRRANYESLTGLPNRAYFYTELGDAIRRARGRGSPLALMYFDIDRFKLINDTFGHDAGDEVIRTFATRVRGAVREGDFVARLGGDEFVLIVENMGESGAASLVAEKIIAAMAPAFTIGDRSHQVSTSIGIALLEEGMSADQLLKAADDAMYLAKRAGRNCYRMLAAAA